MTMESKKIFNYLKRVSIIRLRIANCKLIGNTRWGLYREYNSKEIVTFIAEFHQQHNTQPDNNKPIQPMGFKTGSNYAVLTRLCEQYYIYEGNEKLRNKIVAEVSDIITELRNDTTAHQEFEAVINTQHNNIITQFRHDYPMLKEKDYLLYAYLVAQLSATTIAVLIGKDKSVVYNRISRLKRSIKEHNNATAQRYLDKL